MKTVNIGILAHVDAGKTSLTERLLYEAGAIAAPGRVDSGDTRTDTMALERARGITIQSAVVSLTVANTAVTIIDTPGHAEFVSEVDRALRVLDGAILVISAVEGIQARTRILAAALRRLKLPYLIFANKIDRTGAREADLLAEIDARLTTDAVPMNTVARRGERAAKIQPYVGDAAIRRRTRQLELLADHSDEFLASYLDESMTDAGHHAEFRRQVAAGLIHPVFFGSAINGAGVRELLDGVPELLPSAGNPDHRDDRPLTASVFKIERGRAGEKIAYARVRTGTVAVRDRVRFGASGDSTRHSRTVTAIHRFADGRAIETDRLSSGGIAKLWGLPEIRVGDHIRSPAPTQNSVQNSTRNSADQPQPADDHFAPPTLETVVAANDPADGTRLGAALARLADEDPLIATRVDADGRLTVRLYGEVQREVLQARLADEFGLAVRFALPQTLHREIPIGVGTAAEVIGDESPTYLWATVGVRVEPGPPGSGITYSQGDQTGNLPRAFHTAIAESVHHTLEFGLRGWPVSDCAVTLVRAGYASPISVASDFRLATPLALMSALRQAGTEVWEPVNRFELDIPVDAIHPVLAAVTKAGGTPRNTTSYGGTAAVEGSVPVRSTPELERTLAGLTGGEGVLATEFEAYQPVHGPIPHRQRIGADPLDRPNYLRAIRKHT